MRTSVPPLTSCGTTRWTGPPKNRVSRGRRLLATGMAALGRWRSTARSDDETPYCSGRSLRTITSPPNCGRNPIPVMAAWPFAGAGLVRSAIAAGRPSVLSGRPDPTSDTVGSPARSRTSGISAGAGSEVEVAALGVVFAVAVGLGVAVALALAVVVASALSTTLAPPLSLRASAAARGTRTSIRFPDARTSKSTSPASSMTTRAVCAPAAATAMRRTAPSPTSCSAATPATAVSARSTTTRGGPASLRVVKLSGWSASSCTSVASGPPTGRIDRSLPPPAPAAAVASNAMTVVVRTGGTLARASPRPQASRRRSARLGRRPAGALAARRVVHQVLHVLADLPQVVAYCELEVGVVLHRAPQEVLAARLAVDAAGALGRGDLVQVAKEHGHRAVDLLEVRLVVVPGAVALHLVPPDPARELFHHPAGLLLAALAEQPAELLGRDPGGIEQRAEVPRDQLVAAQVAGGRDARQLAEDGVHGHVAEAHPPAGRSCRRDRVRDALQEARPEAPQRVRGAVAGRVEAGRGDAQGVDERAQPGQVAVAARVAVAEHSAHAVAQVDDLVAPRALLDRLDRGGDVLQQVAVEVPVPVEVSGERPALLPAQLNLELARAAPVAAQLDDVAVRAEQQQPLDEGGAGEGVPVLGPPGDQEQRLAQDGLLPVLRQRPVAGDLQHPPVARPRVVDLLAIQGLELDLVERRGMWGVKASHVGTRRRSRQFLPRGPYRPRSNLGLCCRYGKNVHSCSLGMRAAGRPRRAACTSAARYSDPQQRTHPSGPAASRAACRASRTARYTAQDSLPNPRASAASCSGAAARGDSTAHRCTPAASGNSSRSMAAWSLSLIAAKTSCTGRPPARAGSACATARAACALCAPSSSTRGRSATTSSRAGHRAVRSPSRTCSRPTGRPRPAAAWSSAHARAAFPRW